MKKVSGKGGMKHQEFVVDEFEGRFDKVVEVQRSIVYVFQS